MLTNAELNDRIKLLEESVSWMQRDINHLIDIIEHLQKPEQHTHYTTIIYTKPCMECDEKGFED